MKITVIIPLRITSDIYQAENRLYAIINNIPCDKFNIVIVNYGSADEYQSVFSCFSAPHIKLVNFDAEGKTFSIGHARDLGVQWAKDDVVIFNDIDFYANTDMYARIYQEVISRDMYHNAYDFFCVPVFFLTEDGSQEIISYNMMSEAVFNNTVHKKISESHANFVDFPAYGSSAIVVNKNHYLAIGGHSREFYGHGAEDYELLHRLASYHQRGPRTSSYYENTRSNSINKYKGFRAFFALYGIDVFNRGIYFQHLWHPTRKTAGYQQTQRNFALLENLMKQFDKDMEQPHPLSNFNVKEKTLLLIDACSRTFKAIRHAMPALGELVIIDESLFESPDELLHYVDINKISQVFILNPYGNEYRLSLYVAMRKAGVNYIVFDRGALPDSWFFDSNGFNYDSLSYHPDKWMKDLNSDQVDRVKRYLFEICNGEDTLEHNAPRKTARFLKEKYKIGNRKVLFVPFQRPSDTVTTYFAGAANSVAEFQEWVIFIARNLSKREWVVVCKNHPLERELPKVDGVIYADDDTHIHDLIELADKVFLMNSGVGVISLAFMKPVICASHSFYAHDGLAIEVNEVNSALALIKSDISVSQERVYQFYYHLIENVYSFGKSKYKKTKASDGSDRNIVDEIIFNDIKVSGHKIYYGVISKGVSLDAPLFYSFGGREGVKKEITSNNAKVESGCALGSVVAVDASKNNQSKNIGIKSKTTSSFRRKTMKLFRDPILFFKDACK
ncbi:TPA: hypothetical protein R4057_002912 [Kluyvera ascorbata]|uniref:glycosyltransferase n=1 Tax=Kluyvera ascorbata TaxID=51288 RepID=UPI00289CFD98|nr:glycosyltransferase [Kluyvera ascorbata]MEB6390250.1 galactosyltransferase-related protein [Kluyvera ascorbata]HED3065932.1 hypothetical protein [Kluyvera ascorbata]